VLGEGFQRSPYSLTEGRVIYELAQAKQIATVELRRRLGLDAGYLSRILTRFEADGMVRLQRSISDNRRQLVELTPNGGARLPCSTPTPRKTWARFSRA
jgi:DNA-binding MarR family transcriptional regulator